MNSLSIEDRISIPRSLKSLVVDVLESRGYRTGEEGHIFVSQYHDKPVAFIGLGNNGLELELTNNDLTGFEKYHQELRNIFQLIQRLC